MQLSYYYYVTTISLICSNLQQANHVVFLSVSAEMQPPPPPTTQQLKQVSAFSSNNRLFNFYNCCNYPRSRSWQHHPLIIVSSPKGLPRRAIIYLTEKKEGKTASKLSLMFDPIISTSKCRTFSSLMPR